MVAIGVMLSYFVNCESGSLFALNIVAHPFQMVSAFISLLVLRYGEFHLVFSLCQQASWHWAS